MRAIPPSTYALPTEMYALVERACDPIGNRNENLETALGAMARNSDHGALGLKREHGLRGLTYQPSTVYRGKAYMLCFTGVPVETTNTAHMTYQYLVPTIRRFDLPPTQRPCFMNIWLASSF